MIKLLLALRLEYLRIISYNQIIIDFSQKKNKIIVDVKIYRFQNNPKLLYYMFNKNFVLIYSIIKNSSDMYLQASQYQIVSMIGQGSAHEVFKARHNLTQKVFALKIEKFSQQGQIEGEIKILKELNDIEGIPRLVDQGKTPDNRRFLIMPQLNCSLRDLAKTSQLSLPCILAIGLSVIKTLEQIHRKKILHLDIKPDNIMIQQQVLKDLKGQILTPGFIQLIDFGLSQFIGNSKFLQNVFVGSLNFASRASHRGEQLGYKDDMESLFYVLVYLRNGKLPWSEKSSMKSKDLDILQIGRIKTSLFNTMTLSKKFPIEFSKLMSHIDELKYDEIPDYQSIKGLFINMLQTTSLSSKMDQFLTQSPNQSFNQQGNSNIIQIPVDKLNFNNNSIETQIKEDLTDVEVNKVQHLSDLIGKYATVQIKSILDIKY
ncbi:unnamed protein product [Paramecium octaurelia]|uniref:Casein kinase I n=1 Tax=Paramecium octaurelia TaxID=43137 RepID=A0A8S1YEA6_PAROT|nr:unnamed protein product [Paramecium octaurelia]